MQIGLETIEVRVRNGTQIDTTIGRWALLDERLDPVEERRPRAVFDADEGLKREFLDVVRKILSNPSWSAAGRRPRRVRQARSLKRQELRSIHSRYAAKRDAGGAKRSLSAVRDRETRTHRWVSPGRAAAAGSPVDASCKKMLACNARASSPPPLPPGEWQMGIQIEKLKISIIRLPDIILILGASAPVANSDYRCRGRGCGLVVVRSLHHDLAFILLEFFNEMCVYLKKLAIERRIEYCLFIKKLERRIEYC